MVRFTRHIILFTFNYVLRCEMNMLCEAWYYYSSNRYCYQGWIILAIYHKYHSLIYIKYDGKCCLDLVHLVPVFQAQHGQEATKSVQQREVVMQISLSIQYCVLCYFFPPRLQGNILRFQLLHPNDEVWARKGRLRHRQRLWDRAEMWDQQL